MRNWVTYLVLVGALDFSLSRLSQFLDGGLFLGSHAGALHFSAARRRLPLSRLSHLKLIFRRVSMYVVRLQCNQ